MSMPAVCHFLEGPPFPSVAFVFRFMAVRGVGHRLDVDGPYDQQRQAGWSCLPLRGSTSQGVNCHMDVLSDVCSSIHRHEGATAGMAAMQPTGRNVLSCGVSVECP